MSYPWLYKMNLIVLLLGRIPILYALPSLFLSENKNDSSLEIKLIPVHGKSSDYCGSQFDQHGNAKSTRPAKIATKTLSWCHVKRTDSWWKPIPTDLALSKVIFLLVYSSENVECPLTRKRKQWKQTQFPFSKVSASAYESVRLRECVNTEFDWEVKTGIGKRVRK